MKATSMAVAGGVAGPRLTLAEKISSFALRIYGSPAKKVSAMMPGLREQILKSNLRSSPDSLIAVALLASTISAVGSIVCVGLALSIGPVWLSLGALAPAVVFALVWQAPRFSQGSRSRALANELPFVIGYMEVLAGGGISPITALGRLSSMEEVFPAASKEARRILIETDVLGLDPMQAIEKAARYSPNKPFSEFLYGYTTVLKTGGDVRAYVNTKLKEALEDRSAKMKRASDTIGTLSETYLILTAVLGISLFALYQIQGVVAKNSNAIQNLYLFAYIVIPVISLLFIVILDGIHPKEPHLDLRPYKAFLFSIPVGLAIYFLPLGVNLFLQVSIALATIVAVPAFLASKYTREVRGMEKALPDFVRDVAEGRKIGLAPEGSIELLGNKNYGRLSSAVRKMASQISWGLPVSRVVSYFTAGVASWVTRVVGTLMIEVVDVGGGTVRSFSEMADFVSRVNEIESEKRSSLRPYLLVSYMAGLLLVVTTFIMVYFLYQSTPAGHVASQLGLNQADPATVEKLLVAAIFESWVVGFVAGKMGEGSVSQGFKHSFLLVVTGVIAVYVSLFFVPIKF